MSGAAIKSISPKPTRIRGARPGRRI